MKLEHYYVKIYFRTGHEHYYLRVKVAVRTDAMQDNVRFYRLLDAPLA